MKTKVYFEGILETERFENTNCFLDFLGRNNIEVKNITEVYNK